MIELDGYPELVDPLLIAAFEGWNDAGDAASGAVEHLELAWGGTRVAEHRLEVARHEGPHVLGRPVAGERRPLLGVGVPDQHHPLVVVGLLVAGYAQFSKQKRPRFLRRRLFTKMLVSLKRGLSSPGRAFQETFLDQEWFVNFFNNYYFSVYWSKNVIVAIIGNSCWVSKEL